MAYSEKIRKNAARKAKKATREPFPVRRSNWIDQGADSPPLCAIHNEVAIWHKNKARQSGGQWACKICAREKSRGARRKWKTEHTDPFTYNLKRSFAMAKHHSKKIGRDFEIEFDDILRLWEKQSGECAVSGIQMEYIPGDSIRNRNKVTIDRIDSSIGYVANNIWLVCDWVNRAKSDLDFNELNLFAQGIIRNRSLLSQRTHSQT